MKVYFYSLGCDKNRIDSEKILKFLMKKFDVEITSCIEDAEIAIVNTCSFVRDAKIESIQTIKELVRLKRAGTIKKIMVLGCLATEYRKYRNQVIAELDESIISSIDCILPLDNYLKDIDCLNDRICDILSFSSSIKISDGCDRFCSYCIIPYLRGRYRSNNPDNILLETKKLAKNGVKELSIVSQDTLNYGYDIKNNYFKNTNTPITKLINDMSKVEGIKWLRLLYCYPEEVNDDVIKLYKENKKLIPYIDIPIQHISDNILRKMNRKTNSVYIRNLINKLRNEIPNIVIRTTLIVGFPSETDADFKMLCEFVKEMKFDKLGVFTYSREKLSKSYSFDNQVCEDEKNRRRKIIYDIQRKIIDEKNKQKISYVYEAIVDGYDVNKKMYVVRPYFDAKDIDEKVYVKTKELLISGDFVNVQINKVNGIDLEGELV